jgi:signal transduction histidine kinase
LEKETSCINAKAILDYVKAHNQGDCSSLLRSLHPDVDQLANPEGFLTDPNNWISYPVICELYKRAKTTLADDAAPYRMGEFAVRNLSLGYIQKILVKAFWSYKTALKHAQKINDKLNRSKRIELVRIKRNEAVVRLHWDPNMKATKDICLYNQGIYTFMPLIWEGNPLSLKEESCYFDGGPYCEYHLKWPARNRASEIFSRFYTSKSVLMDTVKEMESDKKIIEQKYEEVNRLNDQLNQRIKQLMAVQETGKAILSVLDLEKALSVIMNLLSSVCNINRAIIMLVNEEKACLEYIQGIGFDAETHKMIKDYEVPLHRVSNMLIRVLNTGQSEYVPQVESSILKKDNVLLAHGKPTSVFVVPLITRSKVIGVIATDAVDNREVPKETRETLEVFAPQIAIAIENAKLYSSLQERMSELKRSQALLSRAEKLSFLGNLAARLAHELKNPLTAIGTFLQLLPQKYDDEEFRRGFHKVALEETMRMNDLITELLDLVRPRECHFASSDLPELIDKMILLVSAQGKAKKIEIVHKVDRSIGPIWMDSERIKQVILNLLSNAIDFTPIQGRIEIATNKINDPVKGEAICIRIKDNGIGIPPSNMEKIYDPFFTTKHKSTIHRGTGLGLFIAHQHMQDHHGSIEAKSAPNEGTTFILTLPAAPGINTAGEGESLLHAH